MQIPQRTTLIISGFPNQAFPQMCLPCSFYVCCVYVPVSNETCLRVEVWQGKEYFFYNKRFHWLSRIPKNLRAAIIIHSFGMNRCSNGKLRPDQREDWTGCAYRNVDCGSIGANFDFCVTEAAFSGFEFSPQYTYYCICETKTIINRFTSNTWRFPGQCTNMSVVWWLRSCLVHYSIFHHLHV